MADLIPPASLGGAVTSAGAYYNVGNQFYTSEPDGAVDALSWYRYNTLQQPPERLFLWKVGIAAPVASVAPTDTGAAGWQSSVVSAVNLDPFDYYIAGARLSSNGQYSSVSPAAVADTPLTYASSYYTASGANSTAIPATFTGGANEYAISAHINPTGGTPGPATTPDVETTLASWLISTGDNTHQADGLPWITHTLLALLTGSDGSQVGDISQLAPFPVAQQSLFGAFRELFELVGGVAGVISLVNGIRDLTPGLNLTDAFNALSSEVDANAGTLGTVLARSNPFDGATWTLSAEVDFDTALAWNVAADVYVISFTTVPDFRPVTFVAGINWLPRLAWWAPWNGLQVGERHFIDFDAAIVADGSNLIPGILLYAEGGGAGHIQAWLRP